MKYILLLLAALTSFASFAVLNPAEARHDKAPADVDVRLHEECLYPVVQMREVGNARGASGFVVRSEKLGSFTYYNLFLTCAHCIGEAGHEVNTFRYEDWSYVRTTIQYPCIFYGFDYELDTAVGYFLSDEAMPTVKLAPTQKLYIGSEIFKIGCGLRQEPRVEFGKVNRPVRSRDVSEKFLRLSAMTVPGDSGSPVFYKYRVIGLTTHIAASRNVPVWGLSYCMPLARFYEWSKDNGGIYDHIFHRSASMPRMPLYRLEILNAYEITR